METLRYSKLKRIFDEVTHKMLSTKLKELEKDNLIIRKEYPQIPPKVKYYLSETGLNLMPILSLLCKLGYEHMPNNNK